MIFLRERFKTVSDRLDLLWIWLQISQICKVEMLIIRSITPKCEEAISKWLVREECKVIAKCIFRLKILIKDFKHNSFNSNIRTVWESILNNNRTLNNNLELIKTNLDQKEVNKCRNLNKVPNLDHHLLDKRVLPLGIRKGQAHLDCKGR